MNNSLKQQEMMKRLIFGFFLISLLVVVGCSKVALQNDTNNEPPVSEDTGLGDELAGAGVDDADLENSPELSDVEGLFNEW